MMIKTLRFCMSLIVAHLVIGSPAFAQNPVGQAAPEYLNFGQFETIVPADRLSFFDRLKWAGMKFVNAPAADRIASLYEYDTNSANQNTDCSDTKLRSHHALLIDQKISTSEMISVAKSGDMESSFKTTCALNDVISELNQRQWVSKAMLDGILGRNNCQQLVESAPDVAPVWHEFSFSNSCELRDILLNLDDDTVAWSLANDPKLRSIIESATTNTDPSTAPGLRVIVDDQFFAASSQKQYFAECKFQTDNQNDNFSLCGTIVH